MKQCPRSYLVVSPRQSHARQSRASRAMSRHWAKHAGSISNTVVSRIVALGASLMLVSGAVLTLPYGYFSLLRVVVFGCAAYLCWLLFESEQMGGAVALGSVALLFNPFLPVYLTRGIWQVIDMVVAVLMIFAAFAMNRPLGKRHL